MNCTDWLSNECLHLCLWSILFCNFFFVNFLSGFGIRDMFSSYSEVTGVTSLLLFKMVFLPCKNLPELTCETIYICISCCCYFCWWWFSKITNAQIMKFGLLISWLYPMIYNSFSIRSSPYNTFYIRVALSVYFYP